MWAGTSALQSIDQSLQTVRNETLRLDHYLSDLTNALANNRRQKLSLIRQIAAVRLSEIEQGELAESLNYADKKALETLSLRKQALEQLNAKIDRLNHSVVSTEVKRQNLLDEVNSVSEKLTKIEEQVQSQLKNDAEYLAQFEQASHAQAVAQEAEQKVTQANQDMASKAKPYQNDSLFMYLWERGFGTSEYRGKLFVRMMDSWVAGLIKYQDARVNYWNLTQIPIRLNEHAEFVAEQADQAHDVLQAIELNALEQAGANKTENQIEQAREVLDECDDNLEDIESQLNDELEKRASFTSAEDNYMQQALNVLSDALKHENLDVIHRYVRATHSPTDDQLVIQLQHLQDQEAGVHDNLADVRAMHHKQRLKLSELESIRRNFKNARFDDIRSGFTNKNLLVGVLGQFVQGLIEGSDVWRTIQRNQRYREMGASPDFGSDGLDGIGEILVGGVLDHVKRRQRKVRRSTWNRPRSRRSSGSVFRSPRSKRGGGFSTGGGF